MSKSNLVTLQDLLDLGTNQLSANILRAEIIELARDFFTSTEDYIDIESCVFQKNVNNPTMRYADRMHICGKTHFSFLFSIDYTERDEDVHVCRLHDITFHLNGSKFDMTEALLKEFTNHIQSTGIKFVVTISRK